MAADEMSVDRPVGTREHVLTAIRTASTPPSIDELASAVGKHPNSVRLHVAALRDAGLIGQGSRAGGGRGRPVTVYSPTSRGARAGHRNYEALASVLVDHLASTAEHPESAARNAGRTWGARLADGGVGRTTAVLDDLGFEPEARGSSITLRNCPFRELVDSHQRLVCALHAGLLDGLAEPDGSSATLLPFTSPTTCTVRLDAPPA